MSKIIAVNAGSSSLKFQLFGMPKETVICSGVFERIGLEEGIYTIKFGDQKKVVNQPIADHTVAVNMLLASLVENNIVGSLEEINGVGHRVVHGGEAYAKSVELTDAVAADIASLNDLAPLHNPANLVGYESFKAALPNVRHTAVFDTAFHQTMEEDVYLYPVPYEYYEQYKVRRYGFHGTSHLYVSQRMIELLGNPAESKIITCHLGNGASIAAVQNGISINTSMGFTPLAGIMMGTRSGDVDPAIITYIMKKANKSAEEVVNDLNKKSGMLGVSGISSDARDIEDAINDGNEQALLTRKMYVNRIAQTIGSYFVQMGGVDAIVFTAGLGENDISMRAAICDAVRDSLGVKLNYGANQVRGKETCISKEDSKVQVWLIPTNEELVIARDTVSILGL